MEIYNPCGNQFENHNTTALHSAQLSVHIGRVRFQLVLLGSSITLFESIKLRTEQERAVTVAARILRSTTRQFQFNEQYKLRTRSRYFGRLSSPSMFLALFSNFLFLLFVFFFLFVSKVSHIAYSSHVSETHFGCA